MFSLFQGLKRLKCQTVQVKTAGASQQTQIDRPLSFKSDTQSKKGNRFYWRNILPQECDKLNGSFFLGQCPSKICLNLGVVFQFSFRKLLLSVVVRLNCLYRHIKRLLFTSQSEGSDKVVAEAPGRKYCRRSIVNCTPEIYLILSPIFNCSEFEVILSRLGALNPIPSHEERFVMCRFQSKLTKHNIVPTMRPENE